MKWEKENFSVSKNTEIIAAVPALGLAVYLSNKSGKNPLCHTLVLEARLAL